MNLRSFLLVTFSILFFVTTVFTQNNFNDFFNKADAFLQSHVKDGYVDYPKLAKSDEALQELIDLLAGLDDQKENADLQKAFRINAYNLFVIKKVMEHYPITSVQQVNHFFDAKTLNFSGQKMSLNELEKKFLLETFADNRLHFVLVCGAVSCAPLYERAFVPDRLKMQIEERTTMILNDPAFIKNHNNKLEVSEIFKWYAADFGSAKSIRQFLNKYLDKKVPLTGKIHYYKYDWSLNTTMSKAVIFDQYKASALLPVKGVEFKAFNALYTQRNFDGFEKLNSRSTYFSIFNQFLYGFHPKWSGGFDLVIKSNVVNDFAGASPFKALAFQQYKRFETIDCPNNKHPNSQCYNEQRMNLLQDTLRRADGTTFQTEAQIGIAHIGAKIKFNPIKKWRNNLSFQQTLYIPIQKHVDGQYISFTQLFFDKPLSPRTQLFVEASLWAPLAPSFKPLPPFIKAFFSYFPGKKWALYAMTTVPFEYGAGTKYKITPHLEIEFLVTGYVPFAKINSGARANTFNIGVIYN